MLKAGITGGIGSGKSMVCQVFETLGIPVFYADEAARYIMEHDGQLVKNITSLFGSEAYVAGRLNRKKISEAAFTNRAMLTRLNELVHPVARAYANDWAARQTAPYVIKEAAIFFESGTYTDMDVMIGVTAPQDLRLARATSRGHQTREQVLNVMARQMNEEEKMNRCDYVINNDETQAILPQIMTIHAALLAKAG